MVYPFGQRAVVLLSSPRPLSALVLLHWTNSSSSVSLPLGSVSLHSSRFEESTVSSVAIFREFLMGLHRSLLRACVVPLWPRCAITLTAVKKIKANFAIGKLAVEGSTLYICWNCFSENTQKSLMEKLKQSKYRRGSFFRLKHSLLMEPTASMLWFEIGTVQSNCEMNSNSRISGMP